MKSIVSQFMLQLSHEEKLELLADLKAAIADEIAGFPEEPDGYPRCGCPAFVKKGRDADGAQRRACKGCGRTFPANSGSLLANSKLGPSVWMAFAECMADALSLRESAERCGVSLYTSWFMRMRVCEVMRSLLLPARAGTFHVDGTLVRDNLSGNLKSSSLELVRAPPQRAGRPQGGEGPQQGEDRRGVRGQQVRRLLLRRHRPRLGGRRRARPGPFREDPRRLRGGERRASLLRLRRVRLGAQGRGPEGPLDGQHQHGQRAPFEAEGVFGPLPRGGHPPPAALPGLVLLRRAVQARGHGSQGAALRARGQGDVLDHEAHDPSGDRKPHGVLDKAVSLQCQWWFNIEPIRIGCGRSLAAPLDRPSSQLLF